MNDEWWRMSDEWWRMMISSCWGVLLPDRQTDGQMDIGDCRVAFVTEKMKNIDKYGEEGSDEGDGKENICLVS